MTRLTEYDRKASAGGVSARTAEADVSVSSNGRRVTGWASVFDVEYPIVGYENGGRPFTEVVRRGAFMDSLKRYTPISQWAHGHDPAVGVAPVMTLDEVREDGRGLYFAGDLFDVAQLDLVRASVAANLVGASFRFRVATGGERWSRERTYRELTKLDVIELGPTPMGANPAASVSLRNKRRMAEIDSKPAGQRTELDDTRRKALELLERDADRNRRRRRAEMLRMMPPKLAAEILQTRPARR